MARTKGKVTSSLSSLAYERYAKKSSIGFKKFDSFSVDMKEMIVGVGCCVSLSESLHIFVMAPDAERLQESLEELRVTKEERSHPDVSLVAMYPARELDKEKVQKEEKKAVAPKTDAEIQEWKEGLEVVWAYHCPSDCVLMIWRRDLGTDDFTDLGDAKKKTALEAKMLMKRAGWSIADVKEVEINDRDNPDDEIPF